MSYKVRDYLSPFFTAGRPRGIKSIVVHHGATTSFDGIGATFQSKGVSAHYGVGDKKNVDRYVFDGNIAYHAGDWSYNEDSIGIEHVNSTGAPDWKISQKTFDISVELARDIAKRHGLLPLVPFKNLFPHGYIVPTFCPSVLKDRLQEYADAVNGKSVKPSKPKKKSNKAIADEVMKGLWGVNPERKKRLTAAGYDYNAIQALVNKNFTTTPVKKVVKKSITTVAKEVIAGAYGNEPQRTANLKRAGYNPTSVQKKVNELLGVGTGKPVPSGGVFAVGQRVKVTKPVDFNGTKLGVSGTYTVMEVSGNRIVIGRGGQVTAAIHKNNIKRA